MLKKGICHLSVIPVRSNAGSKHEMVTQLLFGETYKVLEIVEDWLYIENDSDSYKGWISSNQFCLFNDISIAPNLILTYFPYTELKFKENSVLAVPGSQITEIDGNFSFNGNRCELNPNLVPIQQNIIDFAKLFMNTPYLWGGKSFMGIDCSGFTSVVFACFGIRIPRDASEQALIGKDIAFVNEIQPADLVFFANNEGKITHVGIAINQDLIIHASGSVRIDHLDSFGIFNHSMGKHTHSLKCIKRLL